MGTSGQHSRSRGVGGWERSRNTYRSVTLLCPGGGGEEEEKEGGAHPLWGPSWWVNCEDLVRLLQTAASVIVFVILVTTPLHTHLQVAMNAWECNLQETQEYY